MLFNNMSSYGRNAVPLSVPIVVYGTQWCGMTQMIRRYLDRLGIPYRYIDLDTNPGGRAQLQWLTGGFTSHPTVYINGQVLVEPSINEVRWAVEELGYT